MPEDKISRCLEGDHLAFGELVDDYQGLILSAAFRWCRDRHEAEEIAQETFVRAYRSLGSLEEPGRFGGWLLGIGRNVWRQRARSASREIRTLDLTAFEESLSIEDDDATMFEGHDPRDVLSLVATELGKLPEGQQLVLTLRHFEGLACKEIGRRLGLSVAAVTMKLSRGHRELRRALTRKMNRAGELR